MTPSLLKKLLRGAPALLFAATALAMTSASVSASVVYSYWSFNEYANGNALSDNPPVVTAETFTGTPSLSAIASIAKYSNFASTAFTAFDSVNYAAGEALSWEANSTGNGFTLALDMTNTTDLTMRYDYRGTSSVGFTTFSAIEYSVDGGLNYFSTIASPTMTMNSNVNTISGLDFSGVSAIENQSSVLIRFSLGNVPASNSFRIDNLQLMATVPEPTTFAFLLGFCALGAVAWRRRRA